jgi:hypothetical protein
MRLAVGRVRQVSDCRMVRILFGLAGLRYRVKGLWFKSAEVGPGTGRSVVELISTFPPDTCGAISPQCLQQRMQTKPRPDFLPPLFHNQIVKAMGPLYRFDGGEGEPCLLGLPCGPVMEPRKGFWTFDLVDKSISGDWLIWDARGGESSNRFFEGPRGYVKGGRVNMEGRLRPDNLYKYRLVDKSGHVLSSGNFFLLSRERVEAASWRDDRPRTIVSVDWLDTLAEFGLDWDAYQQLHELE